MRDKYSRESHHSEKPLRRQIATLYSQRDSLKKFPKSTSSNPTIYMSIQARSPASQHQTRRASANDQNVRLHLFSFLTDEFNIFLKKLSADLWSGTVSRTETRQPARNGAQIPLIALPKLAREMWLLVEDHKHVYDHRRHQQEHEQAQRVKKDDLAQKDRKDAKIHRIAHPAIGSLSHQENRRIEGCRCPFPKEGECSSTPEVE